MATPRNWDIALLAVSTVLLSACGRWGYALLEERSAVCQFECDGQRLADGGVSGGLCPDGIGNCEEDPSGCGTTPYSTDPCGACGNECAFERGVGACQEGQCTLASCEPGYDNCDGNAENGCEAALDSLSHCGACGQTCAFPQGVASCASGDCALAACETGFGDCDANSQNGCESSLHSLERCGSCSTPCALDNAAVSCKTGSCTLLQCNAGFGNCDGEASNGCEASLDTLTDCGGCGVSCSGPSCAGGVCSPLVCPAGQADCNADGLDCETATNTLADCGSCGAPCGSPLGRLPNADATCQTGSCAIAQCDAGSGDCDGQAGNGCEQNLTTLSDCGDCGATCSLPSAQASCATGTCEVASCNAGLGDCDGVAVNGCERSLTTLTDCGGCGSPCSLANAQASCATGSCAVATCNAGFDDCDGLASNGCERSLTTLTDCGGCGSPCSLANAQASCATGSCAVATCNAGFGDCDGLASNGCERSLATLTDCGGCGSPCSLANAQASCTTGSCAVATCNAGFDDCDGLASNGCEANLLLEAHCGACGNACEPGETCQGTLCIRSFDFAVSNVAPDDLDSGSATTATLDCGTVALNTTTLTADTWCGGPAPTISLYNQPGGPDLAVVELAQLVVEVGSTLQIRGSRPAVLVVFGDATIAGSIDASASGSVPGAGGGVQCLATAAEGGGGNELLGGGGGGGGGFGSPGGDGGGTGLLADGGSGGTARGTVELSPLVAGCPGGAGGGCDGDGAAAGAVQLAVAGALSVSGSILADGADGSPGCTVSGGGHGGGSGGAIMLEARSVTVAGQLRARGGDGGDGGVGALGGLGGDNGPGGNGTPSLTGGSGGGGSAGRIRVVGVDSCSLGGSVLPAASLSCT